MLSAGDRLALVNSYLSSITLYMLPFLEAPKGFIKKPDIIRKRMIWQELDDKKKYHLVKWDTVCLPQDCGGLGVLHLATMNKSLLCKWLWNLENGEGTWQQLLTKKYLQNQVLANAHAGPCSSYFWQGLMGVNPIFQQFAKRVMKDGKKTLFWGDNWVNNIPLATQFPRLYNLAFKKCLTVYTVKQEGWGLVRFRRMLYGKTLAQWEELKRLVDGIHLNDQEKDNWTNWQIQSERFVLAFES
jgi:hypothetical protein